MVPSQTFSSEAGSKRTSSTWYLPYEHAAELIDGVNRLTGMPFVNLLHLSLSLSLSLSHTLTLTLSHSLSLSLSLYLTDMPFVNFEEPQVVRYEIGQQFSWHYDAIPKSLQDSSGNRIATIIVYLNDVKSGGSTCFKDLELQIKPKKGKAIGLGLGLKVGLE
jgi:hypothetical protein